MYNYDKKKLDIKIKKRLFPFLKDKNKIKNLQIDKDSIHYISLREDAETITEIIKKSFRLKENEKFTDLYITDATAGVGGNTLSFGKNFKYVNSIEIHKKRYKFLENNIKIYEFDNINTYNENCIDIIDLLYQDIIFIDPPWGGKDYKKKKNLRLSISEISIEQLCLDIVKNKLSRMIVLKLPLNYDINYFKKVLYKYDIDIYELNKMLIMNIHL